MGNLTANIKSCADAECTTDRKASEAAERAAAMSNPPAASFPTTYTKYLNGRDIPGYTATVPENLIGLALAAVLHREYCGPMRWYGDPAAGKLADDDRAWLKSDDGRHEEAEADRALEQHAHDLERALAATPDYSEHNDLCWQMGLPGCPDERAAMKKTLREYKRDLKALRKEERERSVEHKTKAARKALAALKAADRAAHDALIATAGL